MKSLQRQNFDARRHKSVIVRNDYGDKQLSHQN